MVSTQNVDLDRVQFLYNDVIFVSLSNNKQNRSDFKFSLIVSFPSINYM